MDYGLRTTDYGLRTTDYGLWTIGYGLRTMDYRLRTTDYGLSATDQGLASTTLSSVPRTIKGWYYSGDDMDLPCLFVFANGEERLGVLLHVARLKFVN
jgi:hypothetical protein